MRPEYPGDAGQDHRLEPGVGGRAEDPGVADLAAGLAEGVAQQRDRQAVAAVEERIWTVIATCAQQGRSVFAYLEAAVMAWFEGTEAPSLLPEV